MATEAGGNVLNVVKILHIHMHVFRFNNVTVNVHELGLCTNCCAYACSLIVKSSLLYMPLSLSSLTRRMIQK